MLPDPFEAITMEDLPNEGLVDLAQACGLDVVVTLMRCFPGQQVFVPQNGLARVWDAAARAGRPDGPVVVEDLPNATWQAMAMRCGVPVVLSLLEHAGNILVVTPRNPFRKLFRRYIKEHHTGFNGAEVSIMLGLGRSHFYNLLNDLHPGKKSRFRRGPSDPMQMSLV